MAISCHKCAASLRSGAHFCGSCGTPTRAEGDTSDAIERFREVLARFGSDSQLGDSERQQLEALRERLGIAPETAEELISGYRHEGVGQVDLRLSIDVSTIKHFEVDSRCMLRFRLENHGDLAFETLEILGRVFGEQELEPTVVPTLFPGKSEVVPLWLVPQLAGFQELRGVLHAIDLMGERSFLSFDRVQFRVGSASSGPNISVVNIDQSSARVVDNSRSQFAAESSAGALVQAGEWVSIPLRGVTLEQVRALVPALAGQLDRRSIAAKPNRGRDEEVNFSVVGSGASYQVSSTIARGDLATVYGGTRDDGAQVAVKVVDDKQDNDLMQVEINTLRRIHAEPAPQLRHFPEVLDQFRTGDQRVGTVFARLDGHDLLSVRERLPDGVPARHMIWLMRRCLSALGLAHSRGVIHGNLDPSHIVLRPRDHNVWIIDWSYSIVEPALTQQGFRVYNDEYSAPEVGDRKPPLPAADLYSLGKCMFFAAGGDPRSKTLPDSIDERLRRFMHFFVMESALGRAQDAWKLYTQLDRLRQDIYGDHEFVEFEL